jgi:hypothetical protein
MEMTVETEDNAERLKVKFKPRTQKLVLITNTEQGLKLEKFVGLNKKSEALMSNADLANPEITVDGIKEVIEEFRAT